MSIRVKSLKQTQAPNTFHWSKYPAFNIYVMKGIKEDEIENHSK